MAAAAALVRVLRRMLDVLVIFAGVLATLRHFGVNLTPALAGLGVGGIAVALAAQKTLENVIAGASLIFDQAVRTGDVLKMGDVLGTVEHIGLRSTRLRTLDRTARERPERADRERQPRDALGARQVLVSSGRQPSFRDDVPATRRRCRGYPPPARRAPFGRPRVGAGAISSAWRNSRSTSRSSRMSSRSDWDRFLEIQEQLLFGVTEAVESAGTQIAFRPQTMYFATPLNPRQDALEPQPAAREGTPSRSIPMSGGQPPLDRPARWCTSSRTTTTPGEATARLSERRGLCRTGATRPAQPSSPRCRSPEPGCVFARRAASRRQRPRSSTR